MPCAWAALTKPLSASGRRSALSTAKGWRGCSPTSSPPANSATGMSSMALIPRSREVAELAGDPPKVRPASPLGVVEGADVQSRR